MGNYNIMGNKYYEDELRKISNQTKNLRDQYNTLDNPYDSHDIEKVIDANLEFAPSKGQTLKSYDETLKIYYKLCCKKNIQTHINGPKGSWFTHRNPSGCFACEDMNLMSVMMDVVHLLAIKFPEESF